MATINLFNTSAARSKDLLDIIKDIKPDNNSLMSSLVSSSLSSGATMAGSGFLASNYTWISLATGRPSGFVEIMQEPEVPKPNRLKDWLEAHRK